MESQIEKEIDDMVKVLKENYHLFEEWNKIKNPDDVQKWLSEESAELIVAMHHFYRGRVGKEQVTEEFIDAFTCMVQLAVNTKLTGLGDMMQKKLDKAKTRMASIKNEPNS